MKHFILFASISLACGLLFVNMYTSLIDAKSWGSDIPNSIGAAREYFKAVNPGNFFRIFSPVNQLLGLIVLILFWKSSPSVRLCLGIAFAMYVIAEGMTFMYFFPRNDIMFKNAALTDVELLKKTWSEWNMMNWVRTAVLVVGVTSAWIGVHKLRLLK
ncbi:MAG TPA: anthrone oxygenase family protein [Chitinophagaceae bacterium]